MNKWVLILLILGIAHFAAFAQDDSIIWQDDFNDDEEFPALVRKALSNAGFAGGPVINAGIGNNGNGRWVKFLRTNGEIFNPKIDILQ